MAPNTFAAVDTSEVRQKPASIDQWNWRIAAALCLIFLVSASFAAQGWMERIPISDDVLPIQDAYSLVQKSEIPHRGTMSSLMAYIPPGTTWFWAVGAATTRLPQLLQLPGALLLHAGCILGIFLLGRALLGSNWAGVWVAAAYAFSRLGLVFAVSLWPRGHPFFSSLCVALLAMWIIRRNSFYLASAIATFGIGCYYFLEIAPLGIIFVTALLIFRPRISLRAVILGAALALAVWSPYLVWDGNSGFQNMRTAITRKSQVSPVDPRIRWCDAGTEFRYIGGPGKAATPFRFDRDYTSLSENVPAGAVMKVAKRLAKEFLKCMEGFFSNFMDMLLLPLLGAALAGVVFHSLWIALCAVLPQRVRRPAMWAYLPVVAALASLSLLFLFMTYQAARNDPTNIGDPFTEFAQKSSAVLLCAVVALVMRRIFAKANYTNGPLLRHLGALVVPAFVIIVVAERGHTNRLWWLWPLQLVLLFVPISQLLQGNRALAHGLALAAVAVLSLNSILARHIIDFNQQGYIGKPSGLVTLLDQIPQLSPNAAQANVGYFTTFQRWMPVFSSVNPTYRVGMEANLYLQVRHGVANTGQCAEGFSNHDDFRIIDTAPVNYASVDMLQAVPSSSGFSKLQCAGTFCLYRRDGR